MNILEELKYSDTHEWVSYLDNGNVRVGISDFAQSAMGDIVFINLPQAGDTAVAGEPLCDLESVKAVEDVISPVSGEIVAVNEELMDAPELINSDPYEAWIVEIANVTEDEDLLDAATYEEVCREEE